MVDVLVIGAGASGLAAAVTAAKGGLSVLVLEAEGKPAKKILRTGNGRCNFTHEGVSASAYHSRNMDIAAGIIGSFGTERALGLMSEIGVIPWEKDGYYYPLTNLASSVADCLIAEAGRLGVRILTETPVRRIERTCSGFAAVHDNGRAEAENLVIAAGTPAGLKNVTWQTGCELAGQLGLKASPLLPALTGLCAAEPSANLFRAWNGVRVKGRVSLLGAGRPAAEDTGEIQLTDYGISGIPVFQVCGAAARLLHDRKPVSAVLSFFPSCTEDEAASMLASRRAKRPAQSAEELLAGVLAPRLISAFLRHLRIPPAKQVSAADCRALARLLTGLSLQVTRTKSVEEAQVCTGGIYLDQINPQTMECRDVPGLYLTGELLDADGCCGGYNLHWAWATGVKAAEAIIRKKQKE